MDQIVKRERRKKEKTLKNQEKKKAIKGLVDFNSFIRDEVVGPGQKRLFNLAAHNVKQEIINSYRCEKRKAINLYNALVNDSKSIFYTTDKITKTLIKKNKKLII